METEAALAVIRPGQIGVLALFMAVLGFGWLLVKFNQGGLSRRLHQGKRIKLAEVASLSPTDRALILEVDGRSFLLIRCKGAAPVLHDLGPIGVTEAAP
jgi:flagellar protein FliO/FliZ